MGNTYTKKEEIFNAVTHGLGVVFGIVGLVFLLIQSVLKGNIPATASFSIYGGCIILMFMSSTLYHSITNRKAKKILRVFDHSSIFLFIAGTYTPIIILTLTGKLKWGILSAIWILAVAGVIFKIVTYGKFDKFKLLSVFLYIGMGWIAIIPIKAIVNATSLSFFLYILGGGLLYTLGTIFYSSKKIPYNHGIWHLFVLSASIVHFIGIFIYLA